MKISFYLDRVKKEDLIVWIKKPKDAPAKEATIWMYLTWNGEKYRYNTQQRVKICDWEEVRISIKNGREIEEVVQRVKKTATGAIVINKYLDALEFKVKNFANEHYTNESIPSKNAVINHLLLKNDEKDFTSCFERFITESKNGERRTKKGKIFSSGTTKQYKYNLRVIQDYEKYTGSKITWDSINDKFYNKFTNYLWDERGCFDNVVGARVKILKTFLRWVQEEGIVKTKLYSDKWIIWEQEADIVVLYPDELKLLNALELSGTLEEVRDIFIAGCMTCLRVSNHLNLSPTNLVGDYLKVVSVKSDKPIFIPVNPILKAIFNKYLNKYGTLLPTMYDRKFNFYLKDLGMALEKKIKSEDLPESFIGNEWGKPYTKTMFKRGKPVVIMKDLTEMISSHTMRRTGITNLLMAGLSEIEVKQISDHTLSSKAFQKYVKIAKRFIQDKSNAAWGQILGEETILRKVI